MKSYNKRETAEISVDSITEEPSLEPEEKTTRLNEESSSVWTMFCPYMLIIAP